MPHFRSDEEVGNIDRQRGFMPGASSSFWPRSLRQKKGLITGGQKRTLFSLEHLSYYLPLDVASCSEVTSIACVRYQAKGRYINDRNKLIIFMKHKKKP